MKNSMKDILSISVSGSRRNKLYKSYNISFENLVKRLSKTIYTDEIYEEYLYMEKSRQDDIKDVGGFVGGKLEGGVRRRDTVLSRSILTLDVDFGYDGLWDLIPMISDYCVFMYTTHKHSSKNPRFRMVIPLSREVSPVEYEAIARLVAHDIGIDCFDDSTYEPSRLMYFPSTSKNGEFRSELFEYDFLEVDKYLNRYEDYKDRSSWPVSSRVSAIKDVGIDKQQNPLEKDGLIGAFCRTYDIHQVIDNDNSFITKLEVDKKGRYKNTIDNIVIILEEDEIFKNKLGLNEFTHQICIKKDLPWNRIKNKKYGDVWTDADDSNLRHYLEKVYNIKSQQAVFDAITVVARKYSFHPIKDYLNNVSWDKKPRVEKLFIEYLGAEDNEYTKAVAKKILVAAVSRIFNPGIKFDYMAVFVGPQGIGKSHLINLLGKDWYSDSINTVQGKEAYEQLQEAWIVEMAELSATKKAESEAVKHFISKREDIYRVAYGRRVEKFPRQCVFFGTTNENEFLKDKTGNRRYWPIKVGVNRIRKSMFKELMEDEINQIWAEAVHLYRSGEKLILEGNSLKIATENQEKHLDESPKEGMIREYLNMILPKSWDKMDIGERRRYVSGGDFSDFEEGTVKRDKVCAMEIWVELFSGDPKLLMNSQAREINDILRKMPGWEGYSKGAGKLSFGKMYGYQRAFTLIDEVNN